MSEDLKNNLTSQTPANDWVFANEIWQTSNAVNDALDNPAWLLTRIYNRASLDLLFWNLNPWHMVDDIWKLRTKQAANDKRFQDAA